MRKFRLNLKEFFGDIQTQLLDKDMEVEYISLQDNLSEEELYMILKELSKKLIEDYMIKNQGKIWHK